MEFQRGHSIDHVHLRVTDVAASKTLFGGTLRAAVD
jgi:hypothetical protein